MSSPFISLGGFDIEMSLATQGALQPVPVFEIGEPRVPGILKQDILGARFGVDLRFRGDLGTKANGDLQRTAGLEGLTQVLARALVTEPGEIFFLPNYGIGIGSFLGQPQSAAKIAELRNRIRVSLLDLDDIEEVQKIDVQVKPSGLVDVDIRANVAGRELELSLRIRRSE